MWQALGLLHLKGGAVRSQIRFRGCDLLRSTEREMRAIRGREIALVLQNPVSSLNPALRIGTQLSEAWEAHNNAPRARRETAILDAVDAVSLAVDKPFLRRYPSELSVGQAQRVRIAMATLHRPALLIADEATPPVWPILSHECKRVSLTSEVTRLITQKSVVQIHPRNNPNVLGGHPTVPALEPIRPFGNIK